MRLAIIGSGISGLVCAHILQRQHQVTVFEQNGYVGGHTNTITVQDPDGPLPVDTGFIVFNDWTYPNFIDLLNQLGVDSSPTSMSFSVQCAQSGMEYNGSTLNGLFAQRRNLVNPRFHRMLLDIARFNREAPEFLASGEDSTTVGDYLQEHGYGRGFMEHYLLPMGAAIWSCPAGMFAQFPVKFIIEFYRNHGLLSIRHRPTWRVIQGGSKSYVEAITRGLQQPVRLNAAVRKVVRTESQVLVSTEQGTAEFDEVILACHSDQALRLLAEPTAAESQVLTEFPYNRNEAVLHTDASVLPSRRRAWAAWNYHISQRSTDDVTVTYNMNILQHLNSARTYCVTLNGTNRIAERSIIRHIEYSHPVYTVRRKSAQARHQELIRQHRTSFCGAYWGNGFHEDGVCSALAVCKAFGMNLRSPATTSPERQPQTCA